MQELRRVRKFDRITVKDISLVCFRFVLKDEWKNGLINDNEKIFAVL